MSLEAKHIKGHGLGTRLDWLCVAHQDEGFGFAGEKALTCVDMTVHAPESGKPNTIFSTYKKEDISKGELPYKFIKGAYVGPEQITMAREVIATWDDLKRNDFIELDDLFRRK